MSVLNNSNAIESGGYNIDRSLRFRSSASAYLNRTPASAGNRKTWTYSCWMKRGNLTTGDQALISAQTDSSNRLFFYFQPTGAISLYFNVAGTAYETTTSAVFRDPSAWYHFIISVDTTQSTDTNRVKFYVNGVQQTLTGAYPPQNTDTQWSNTVVQYIGKKDSASVYNDCYLAEVNFIDGQALTPSSFGQTDAVTGVWVPKKYTGTYGTNGFYLPFSDNTSATTLAYDKSGNGNNWTPNNISTTAGATYDSMTDVPTLTSATAANFCTWNPINKHSSVTIQDANLTIYTGTTGEGTLGTIGVSSGKWYFECVAGAVTGGWPKFGIAPVTADATQTNGVFNTGYCYAANGTKRSPGSDVSYGASFAANDVIGVALDMDAGTLTFYKNNVSQGTAFTGLSGTVAPVVMVYGAAYLNCGQRPFSYTPPTGFKALNTFNLPDPTIKKPNQYMDVNTWSGNGASQSIINSGGFQPDFVWTKRRDTAASNLLFDSIRGVYNRLVSDSTAAEVTDNQTLTAFNSNGMAYSSGYGVNASGGTYVGWQWKGGGAAVTNTTGSTSCQLSASPSSGFSVATFTPPASGTSFTIGHGLGVAPKMIVTKIRNNGAANWFVYHEAMGNTGYMALNLTNGNLGPYTPAWNNTSPTSTVATFGSYWIGSSYNMVAYFFAEIAGYSKFGSYTGNGSADGPMVYTGFKPAFVMVKRTDTTGAWDMFDYQRPTYNPTNLMLSANASGAEYSGYTNFIDIVSNGFKLRETDSYVNANGGTYIYMAFASNPFKYSNAR